MARNRKWQGETSPVFVPYSPCVEDLAIYPVKGMQGHSVRSAVAEECGLLGDRRWMVVDTNGIFLSQRELPGLARLSPCLGEHTLSLTTGSETIHVPFPDAKAVIREVRIWHDTLPVRDGGDQAAQWLSRQLGRAVRLVFQNDPALRRTDVTYAPTQPSVSLADGFPLLITSTASLDDLNQRMATDVPMARFRPNIVVTGCSAWTEDTWRLIRIGACVIRLVKPCARCAVILVDQKTGEKPTPREPLRTLATFRRGRRGVMFGQNAIVVKSGVICVSDRIELLEIGPVDLDM
ncbi:MOSC domain-containing protein [Acetobacter senegalensis]|nr:MOSC N-terminal beta barrel domain-containing protein [Acetobacter senegalensis]